MYKGRIYGRVQVNNNTCLHSFFISFIYLTYIQVYYIPGVLCPRSARDVKR
jgi:hypothetical protein